MSYAMEYDIKRSITKPLVIILLIGLILAGIGVAYLEGQVSLSQITKYSVVLSYNVTSNQTEILGLALNPQGYPIKDAKIFINNGWVETNSSGYFLLAIPSGKSYSIMSPTTLQISGINYTASVSSIGVVNVNLKNKSAILYVGSYLIKNNFNNITSYKVYYSQESLENLMRGILPKNYTYIGNIYGFSIAKFSIPINLSEPDIIVLLQSINISSNKVPEFNFTYSTVLPQLEVSNIRDTAVSTASYIFAEFFPLVGLFLTNEFIASLRSNGAIEFIASRPITKKQLIISRYIGGLFALIMGSLITSILMPVTVSYILNTSTSLATIGKMFGMLLVDTIGFYSLLYLVAVLVRKNFIAISIVLYLILYLFNIMNIVAIIAGMPKLMYGTPYGLYEIVMGGFNFGFSFAINYILVTIIGIIWIALPIILAIIIYDRNDSP
ncbi:ABC transporter permease [Caldisphaera sp.]|jgi:ABC-type transport system involved in multi-copper enzyme maturation permease subunit|uniref:ABC transporter permease n=1 Tax=Caldisphaera sp. TaxID=2060322 RepID=UPI003D109A8F